MFGIKAQKYTASFEDGTEIDYEIHNTDPDNRMNMGLFLGGTISVDYFKPDLFSARAGYTIFSKRIEAEGIYYLGSKYIDKKEKITLKSYSTGRNSSVSYNVRVKLQKKRYHGVHFGISNENYSEQILGARYYNTTQIALGYGINRNLGLTWTTYANKKPKMWTRSRHFGAYADLLLFLGGKRLGYTGETTPIGFRAYIEGKIGLGKKRENWGVFGKMGFQTTPLADKRAGVGGLSEVGLVFRLH